MDYAALRKRMVEEQLIRRGISSQGLLRAFYEIERHRFIPEQLGMNAYADFPVPIGESQTISQPYIVALMTESLELKTTDKVLEIGTGSGYQCAILAMLSREVYSVERLASLSNRAQALFKELGYGNIRLKIGDGTLGWEEFAPYDKIMVTAASPCIPAPLLEQLDEGGRLILPLGQGLGQVLTLVEKKDGKINSRDICGCVFVPLVGEYGYPQ
ncbi:MAG: protein-L-isoaspartate(D-aspartate) O-methyltransferase [Candidatus Omnitrophica bacterium]|nr:protein-L-isoaspartate(D-aspartate) O-methyltransferase [Candidatus Omnitrophota bacterium]